MESSDVVLPENSQRLKYAPKPSTAGIVMQRTTVFSRPNTGNTANNGDTIEIALSSSNFIDGLTVSLLGNFKACGTGGVSYNAGQRAALLPRLYGGIHRCIEQIRVLGNNGEVIEDITEFGMISDIVKASCYSQDYLLSNGQDQMLDTRRVDDSAALTNAPVAAGDHYQLDIAAANAAAPSEAEIKDAVNGILKKYTPPAYETKQATEWVCPDNGGGDGRDFCLPLFDMVGFFKQEKYIPLKFMGKITVQIKFYANALRCLKYIADPAGVGNGGAGFRFANLRLSYDTVRLLDGIEAKMLERINSADGGLLMDYKTYQFSGSVPNANADSITHIISANTSNAIACYSVLRNSAAPAYNVDNFATIPNGANGAPIWYYQLGTDKFPIDAVNSFTQARMELEKAFGQYGNVLRSNLTFEEFKTGAFVFAVDLENDPSSNYTGRPTNKGSQLQLIVSGLNGAVAVRVDSFLYMNRTLTIKGNQNIEIGI